MYSFCPDKADGSGPDLTESLKLVDILYNEYGLELINITGGSPYSTPHINRPYEQSEENPLVGVNRLVKVAGMRAAWYGIRRYTRRFLKQ